MTSMLNKVVVITGANAGLGYQTSLQLARMGAHIVMACRSVEKAGRAREALLAELPDARTTIISLDVSEPESVREFGRQFSDRLGQLDILINNAGIIAMPLARNSVGHELQLATNHLGAFAVTGTLLPFFRTDKQARVINIGSLAHRFGDLALDDLNWENTPYREWRAYARSKVALLSFTMEMDRRLRRRRSNVIVLAAHPGLVPTDAHKSNPVMQRRNALNRWFHSKVEARMPTEADGALPIVHAATAGGVSSGNYYGPTGFLEIGGKTGAARINPVATDPDTAKRLWAISERMTGVSYLSE